MPKSFAYRDQTKYCSQDRNFYPGRLCLLFLESKKSRREENLQNKKLPAVGLHCKSQGMLLN